MVLYSVRSEKKYSFKERFGNSSLDPFHEIRIRLFKSKVRIYKDLYILTLDSNSDPEINN